MAHGLALGLISEQAAKLAVDHVPLCADQLQRTGGHAHGTLGGVAHDVRLTTASKKLSNIMYNHKRHERKTKIAV